MITIIAEKFNLFKIFSDKISNIINKENSDETKNISSTLALTFNDSNMDIKYKDCGEYVTLEDVSNCIKMVTEEMKMETENNEDSFCCKNNKKVVDIDEYSFNEEEILNDTPNFCNNSILVE